MGNCDSIIPITAGEDGNGWFSSTNSKLFVLKEITRTRIALDKKLEKENYDILLEFRRNFIDSLKQTDEIFNDLFCRFYNTGSYYGNMRIGTPDEFDWNLVLRLPFAPENIEVECRKGAASYAKLRVNYFDYETKWMKENFFSGGCLIPELIKRWLQSAVDKALRICPFPRKCTELKVKQSGPARTIVITKRGNEQISIDIVPVIQCTLTKQIFGIDDRIYRRMKRPVKCFLIPKPYNPTGERLVLDPRETRKLWTLHFPEEEKKRIPDWGCAKPVIKLLKLLRDTYEWDILASYYLETVVMWLLLEKYQVEEWKEEKMFEKFVEALKKLLNFVQQRKIPYFFSSPHNLISKMSEDQALKISSDLIDVIRKIEENPEYLYSIFDIDCLEI